MRWFKVGYYVAISLLSLIFKSFVLRETEAYPKDVDSVEL